MENFEFKQVPGKDEFEAEIPGNVPGADTPEEAAARKQAILDEGNRRMNQVLEGGEAASVEIEESEEKEAA